MTALADVIFQVLVFAVCLAALVARWGTPLWRWAQPRLPPLPRIHIPKPQLTSREPTEEPNRLLTSLFLQQAAQEVQQPLHAADVDLSEHTAYVEEEHRIEPIEPEDDEEDDDDEEEEEDLDIVRDDEKEVEATASTPLPTVVRVIARPQHLVVDGKAAERMAATNRMAQWINWMSRVLRRAIHLIVIGQSGAGKTTALQVFVETLVAQGVPVVVCDPDAAAGDWPGTQVFGAGDDFDAITRALKAVQTMARTRREARAAGQREFDEFWFIVDEYAEVKDECAVAGTIIEGGLRRWRKLNMHLVIGIQDTQAKTMGFERRTSLLNNARIVNIKLGAGDLRTAITEGEPTIVIPFLEPQRGPATIDAPTDNPNEALPAEVTLGFIVPDPTAIGDEDEDDADAEEEGGGGDKDDQIARMLKAGKSYAQISADLRVATTRISKVKKSIVDL